MLYVKKIGEADFYRPLFQYKETKGALGTSRHFVENDLRFMEKGQVFRKLQEFVNKAGKIKLGAEVVGYMSKMIPEGEREASIWKKRIDGSDPRSPQIQAAIGNQSRCALLGGFASGVFSESQ